MAHSKVKHLLNRDGRYWARVGVPAALRQAVGKSELLTPLGPDRREALRQLPSVVADALATLANARATIGLRSTAARSRPLYPWQLAREHYANELALDDRQRAASGDYDHAADVEYFRPTYREVLTRVAAGRTSNEEAAAVIGWVIDGFAERGNISVLHGSPEWRQLARTLAGVQLEVLAREAERNAGNFNGEPKHPTLTTNPDAKPSDPLAARRISPQSDLSLADLAASYVRERQATPAASRELEITVRWFAEAIEEPRPVYRITRQDIHAYKRALSATPANFAKRFPNATLPQVIKMNNARSTPFPVLSAKTINDKYLSKLHSLLAWCVKNDILPDNPAAGIKVDVVKDRTPPRVNFSPDDMTRIFGSHFDSQDDELRWAMLVSLFAGTRASETAQIKLDSIRHERGVLIMRVEEETKNRGSQRLIPVHAKLIEIGLEDRVKALRAKGATHLFPLWYRQGVESKARAEAAGKDTLNLHFPKFIPRRFAVTYLPKIGISDSRKSWHSFRHSFRTGLNLAGVEKAIADTLTGHVDGSMAATYTHGVSIEALKAAIDRLHFDGFNL